jgi:NAD-dependent DNA ligase
LNRYGLSYPRLQFVCTVQIAHAVWSDLRSFRLPAVCRSLGIGFKHHEAGEDARACGEVALAAASQLNAVDIPAIAGLIGVTPGSMCVDAIAPCLALQIVARRPRQAVSLRWKTKPSSAQPFSGKTVVFTGTLDLLSRDEAEALARSLGARVTSAVSGRTDYLVVGNGPGSKLNRAKSIGVPIFTEDEWFALVARMGGAECELTEVEAPSQPAS